MEKEQRIITALNEIMKIGIIGAGSIGKTLAQKLSKKGHHILIANSRGPHTIDFADNESIKAVELKYAGKSNQQPQFRLAINDKSAADYTITIREDNGDVLYSEKVSGQASKIYQLDSEDSDRIQGTTFEVTNNATNITTVYKIKNLTQTVENMIVSKL